jgi:hypothetical protein
VEITGKKKTHRVNKPIKLRLPEPDAELGTDKVQGLIRNFVVRGGVPKWGTAMPPKESYDKLKKLHQKVKEFTPNEIGHQSVVLVYLDQGKDGIWHFVHVSTEEVHVIP